MTANLVGSVSWTEFFGTLVLFAWAAFMSGQAIAQTWRPWWYCLAYGLLLGVGVRLFEHMLFAAPLVSLVGHVIDTLVVTAVMLLAYRVTLVRKMVRQYPWLYEPAGAFSWREKGL
jgi:branched-chain amino acid transport system ATP-binding protein